MILEKFAQFSIQKYSSSVIMKCISNYWKDRSYINKLRDVLKPDGIIEMFRNKEGNKILCDLL
jgi:membrane protein involved in colicin uptake